MQLKQIIPAPSPMAVVEPPLIRRLQTAYLEFLTVERGLSKNTTKSYEYDLDSYIGCMMKECGGDIAKIDRQHILTFISDMKKMGLSSRTISRRLVAVKQFHRFMFNRGYCPSNPAARMAPFKETRPLPPVMTREEIERLLNAPGQNLRDAAILELMYSCGLRESELCDLRLNDVHWDTRFLRVTGKGDKQRMTPFGEVADDKLRAYVDAWKPKGPELFYTHLGRKFSRQGLWKMIRAYIVQCGLDAKGVTPHTIRHSCGSDLHNGGANLMEICEFLGHASIDTTQLYIHLTPDHLKLAHARLPRA